MNYDLATMAKHVGRRTRDRAQAKRATRGLRRELDDLHAELDTEAAPTADEQQAVAAAVEARRERERMKVDPQRSWYDTPDDRDPDLPFDGAELQALEREPGSPRCGAKYSDGAICARPPHDDIVHVDIDTIRALGGAVKVPSARWVGEQDAPAATPNPGGWTRISTVFPPAGAHAPPTIFPTYPGRLPTFRVGSTTGIGHIAENEIVATKDPPDGRIRGRWSMTAKDPE